MSGKAKDPVEGMSLEHKTSRRTLLKSALMVLGAGAIVQVGGGVLRMQAQETPKKEDSRGIGKSESPMFKEEVKTHKGAKTHKGTKTHKESKSHKTTKGLETPKKEGS